MTYGLLRLLHIAAMTVWVGGPPIAVIGARAAMLRGGETAIAKVRWLISVTPVIIASAVLTVGSGIALIVHLGGLSNLRPTVLAGIALAIATFPVGGFMNRPALMKLREHFEAGRGPDEAAPFVARFAWAHRIKQTLRVAALRADGVPIGIDRSDPCSLHDGKVD